MHAMGSAVGKTKRGKRRSFWAEARRHIEFHMERMRAKKLGAPKVQTRPPTASQWAALNAGHHPSKAPFPRARRAKMTSGNINETLTEDLGKKPQFQFGISRSERLEKPAIS